MAKQLNVDLRFTANNAQAKQQIQDLQTALDKLMTTSGKSSSGLGITKDIAQATSEVAKLQAMLESSKNASGGLDLGKFNQSLAQGQVKISDYAKTLSSLGPQGDQAFAKLAKAIINAEVPLKRTNGLLKEFKTSLANTARWQLSSSMLHGFMGAVQSAYGYAQDLNESLNNIRIVTGQNIEQMATFAKEANKAAQALSTTTTEYTDASLIYYQQGLSDSEVAKRTEVTIKMANAAGQSAQIVSDQLTAVWNNFYDGSKSLEYYADVMTALGAATASSTDEIAGGLEKFAAIGETIGLSYEYAASALTTITSNTRQSEEVVGTALKTIFARIQGLNLGETLDDGTSLNKYSAALEKVGISIFEQNGEIKKMDNILDEMAAKWGTLAKDQQIALAQTVAGVRQYTQLIALMDNWDAGDSDSMVANLDTAYNATGTLQEQADIYAESWEAARDRVTAAAEEIYNQLLNDEFFIDLNNGFAGFLNIVSNTIDALGGLPGVLTVASSIMFRMFGKDMAKAIDDWGYNIKLRSNEGVQEILKLRQESVEALRNVYADNVDTGPVNATSQASFESQATIADTLLVKRQQLLANGQALSEQDERQAQLLLKINEAYGEQAIASAKSLENAQKQSDLLESQARTQIRRYNNAQTDPNNKINITAELNQIKQAQIQYSTLEATFNKLSRAKSNFNSGDEMIQALRTMSETATAAGMDMTAFEQVLAKLSTGMSVDEVLNTIETEMNQIGDAAYNNIEKVNGLREKLQQIGMSDEQINKLIASWERQGIITSEVAENLRNVKVQGDEAAAAINRMQGPPPTVGQKFMAVANTISNIAMSINAVKGLIDTWNNDDMSFGEKLLSTFTTLGMVIPMVTIALSGNNLAMLGSASASIAAALGFDGVAISAKVAAGGVGALWAALWPIALVIAGLTLVITALAAGVKYLSDEYNKDAIAANKAAEAANILKEAYEETKKSYEDMISAMENYQSARDSLDNLTKGTEAYRDALNEANEAALQLIKAGNLIRGEDYDIVGGEIIIKQESIDAAKENQYGKVQEAYAASTMANANASRLKTKADQTKLTRADDKSIWQGVVEGMVTGMAAMMITGNAPAVLAGALTGGVVGAIDTALINKAGNEAQQKQIDNLVALYDEMGEAAFDSVELQKLGIDTANEEYINSLKEIVRATHQAADQMEVAAQIAAQTVLEQDASFQNSEHKDKISDAAGKNYQAEYDKAYEDYLKKAKNDDWFGVGSQENKDAMAEYAKQMGLDQLSGYKVTNHKKGGNVEYEYIDENGEKQTREITQQQIAAQLAAADATKQLEANTQILLQAFNRLESSADAADKALSDFAGGDIKNATNTEFNDLKNELENYKKIDENGNEVTDFTKYITENFSEEEITALGYESAEKMAEAFEKEFNSSLEAWESITIPPAFEALGTDMSLKTAQALENTFKEINLGPGGEQVAKTFSDTFTKALGELNAEDQQKALEQLMTIDWSSWDSLEQAANIMKDFGVEIDTTSEEWQQFTSDMRLATGAIPDFSRLKEDLNTISGILSDLESGDVVSEEDYQTLVKYNDEWERFFMLQADGSRTFIGNASQMRQEMQENIRQQRRELEARKTAQTGFANAGWDHTDANGTRIEADWTNKSGKDVGTAQNLMNAGGATEEALKMLGYTDEVIQNMITKATSGQADLVAEGEAELREMYRRLGEFQDEQLAGMDAQFDEIMASTADNLYELNELLATGDISEEAWAKQAQVLEANAAQNAETLAQLDSVVANFGLNGLDESYTQNLMRIAEGYESCADELANYQATLSAFTLDPSNDELKEQLELAEDNLRAMIKLEEGAAEYGLEVEVLTAQSKRMAKAYGLTAEEAAELAIKNQRMNKGISSLVDNWKNWKKQLSASNKLTQDYAEAIVDCTAAIADLVGASENLELPDEFFNAENIALIERAMQGDVNAVNQLGAAVAETTVKSWEFNEAFASLINQLETWDGEVITIDLDEQRFLDDRDIVLQGINDIKNGVITADQAMSDEWVAALNRMALATGMSVEQMNSMLGSLGVQAKVDVKDVPQVMKVPTYTEVTEPIPVTAYESYFTGTSLAQVPTTRYMWRKYSIPGPSMEVNGVAQVAQISTTDNPLTAQVTRSTVGGGAPAASYSPNRGSVAPSATKGSSSGGGGSKEKEPSKPKTIDQTKKNEVVERYKEVNDALDDLADEYEKASRAADRLWGEHRLDALREQNKLIEEQQELLREKQKQAENYMKQDQIALQQAAAQAGLSFSFDDKGNITNYTDQMTNLYNQLAAAEAHYNSLATGEDQEAYEETILEPLKDKIKAVEDAIEIYEESKELFEELGLDIEDLQDQIMQNNYDIIMEGLELHISFNEEDLENIDYYLSKLEDDFYSMAEAAALMVGANGNSQLNEYLSNLEEYGKAMDDLHKAYVDGEITEAAYQEGLKEIRSNIRDNLSSLLELDKAMMEYYGETLAMAQEELAKYTDRMQQQTEVLQHYGNMMEILGKQLDYDSMGVILQGQVDTIENEMNVAEAAYNMYKQQVEEKRALYEEAIENNDFAAAELYKKEWKAAQVAADEAQSEMLSKTEEWAEAMRAVVENKLAGLAKSLEEALTGGTSFDQINLQLERAVSLQEEYLTTTNQIYETNKLMRTAQQAIDKSTNSVAKQRLKDFIKETDQLQDKAKLSQYELEIQQAKYNLLLAEIALEDAQNAKSTVRLQRDSEGNFGYVYTADQTQLAQAQQELEDAQNSLYNIGLEGAGNYTEKYTQTMQEMYDTLTSITEAYYNGEITSQEDYEAQMLAAQEYYYQQLENYQDLYGIALQTDTRVIQDSWTSSFRTMINNTENWKIKVNDYSIAAGQSLANWYSKVEEISQKTGLDNIANNVKKVTDESKALRDIVLGTDGEPGVINALQQELKEVSDLTRQYATFRTTLQGVITEYEKLINAANRLAEANARAGVNNSSNNSGSSSSNSNNASSSNNTNDLSSSGESNSSSGGTQTANKYKATYNLRGRSNTISGYYSEDAARAAAESAINSAINALTSITFSEKNDIAAAARRSIQIARYNTGGYTGSWGPYGKLGILDEKELILNPEDTENFLASMKVLERILEIIDLQAVNSQLGGTLLTPSIGNSITSQSLEQSVHIEASFPGVQDRNEIEEAFNTLINKASQYANRK